PASAQSTKKTKSINTSIPTRIIVNVCGKTVEEYLDVVERLGDTKADLLEINVSCPNVKEGAIAFGQNRDALYNITKKIKEKAKQPVIMKLSPNVTSISEMAKACEAAGADAISLINTFTAMKIDIRKRSFVLANKTGGLSGPAIKPIAVRMVYECRKAVKIPIIGMGGIASGEDAIEFMMAGASAVAVGMMNFHDPNICEKISESMLQYMKEYDVEDINELIGCVQ
ncbi:MAG: dihydroorotate dehydrogenase, partial [Lachnospiraceae bacterium]|nr:dihydroorotate dehydrogenase [Lachnospiraceae bacterium]